MSIKTRKVKGSTDEFYIILQRYLVICDHYNTNGSNNLQLYLYNTSKSVRLVDNSLCFLAVSLMI